MKVLGLDIAGKSGWALIENGKLLDKGLIEAPQITRHRLPACNLVAESEALARDLINLIHKHQPDFVYVEETNMGRSRTTQKALEFLHCAFLQECLSSPRSDLPNLIKYIDTSKWRSTLEIKLNKEQRDHNKLVKNHLARGKITPKHLAVAWANKTYGLELLQKDDDIADACGLAQCGYMLEMKKAPVPKESLDAALLGQK